MYTNGFVKLSRSLLRQDWYTDANACRLFIHILLCVNYQNGVWKNKIPISRGSMITSVQKLSRDTGLTVSQTRCALRHLLDSNVISIRTTNKYSVITVVNTDFLPRADTCRDKQDDKQNGKQDDEQIENKTTTIEETEENKEFKKNTEKNRKKRSADLLSAPADGGAPVHTDVQSVVDAFNRICRSLPQVQTLSDKRRQAIRAAEKTVGSFGGWDKLFHAVEDSDFLTGRSGSWTGCGFDWILKPANLVKILEGNYAGKSKRKGGFCHDDSIDTGVYL